MVHVFPYTLKHRPAENNCAQGACHSATGGEIGCGLQLIRTREPSSDVTIFPKLSQNLIASCSKVFSMGTSDKKFI